MKINFQVEWVSPPEQGIVAARITEPREFTLRPDSTFGGAPIHDVEPGQEAELFAFFLEQRAEVARFQQGQRVALAI